MFQKDLELFKRLKAQSKNIFDSDPIKTFKKRKKSASKDQAVARVRQKKKGGGGGKWFLEGLRIRIGFGEGVVPISDKIWPKLIKSSFRIKHLGVLSGVLLLFDIA